MPRKPLTSADFVIKRVGFTPVWDVINKHTREIIASSKDKNKVIWLLKLYLAGI